MTTSVIAMAASLTLVVTTSGPAAAATGRFLVGAEPVLTDPEDYRCYPLDIKKNFQLVNETSGQASIYWGRECMNYSFGLRSGASTGEFQYDSANSVSFGL
ncbi:hypothetical protein [Actinophytocola glycyrrhizae]|uniref:Peptidase inhibitor family I36 n=1 Tax=Actinophytocola glycyrrhizae TaxID=2044873 RepID=A0ABV9S7H8_9PSEU